MELREKLLAIELILKDIRGNWSEDVYLRTKIARNIAKSIQEEIGEQVMKDDMELMLNSIDEFEEDFEKGDCDGRFFRTKYPYGYEEMNNLHMLAYTYNDKSDNFKKAIECLTYPECRFDDWNK